MYVTIILAKICYGRTAMALQSYLASFATLRQDDATNPRKRVRMSDSQFVRFKNAGRQHASQTPGKYAGTEPRDRQDRTTNPALEKWDVDAYGELTNRGGPWGDGSWTNRDHVTAHSSNEIRWGQLGSYPIAAASAAQLKRVAPAIVVSGRHHREASYTYGGRTRQASPMPGVNRMQFGAQYPDAAVEKEISEMLEWKANPAHHSKNHSTLRVEMVGGYAFLYKLLTRQGIITASFGTDQMIMHYLALAVASDDGVTRK